MFLSSRYPPRDFVSIYSHSLRKKAQAYMEHMSFHFQVFTVMIEMQVLNYD
jgi:hypothetical protein